MIALAVVLLPRACLSQDDHSEQGLSLKLSNEKPLTSGLPVYPIAPVVGEQRQPGPVRKRTGLGLKMSIQAGYDDNVQRLAAHAQGAFFSRFKPTVAAQGRVANQEVGVVYEGDFVRYLDLSDEDYANHALSGKVNFDVSKRFKLNLGGGMRYSQAARGAIDSRGDVTTKPDKSRLREWSAEVAYGRRIAKAQLIGRLSGEEIRYRNNQQSDRDIDRITLLGKGYYNFSPRFSVLVEGRLTEIDYLNPASALDSVETALSTGARWEATAKTSGEIKLGLLRKRFLGDEIEDFSGPFWEAQVLWEPKPYSKLRFSTARNTRESADPGASHSVDERLHVVWTHGFTERLRMTNGAEFYRTRSDDDRVDDTVTVSSDVAYTLFRWLDLGVGMRFTERRSNTPDADFKDRMLFVNLNVDLGRDGTARSR